MSIILERRQTGKIILLRLLFITLVFLIIALINYGHNDYAIVMSSLFVCLLFPSVVELQVFFGQVSIQKYFFLAMIKKTYTIHERSNLQLTTFDLVLDPDRDDESSEIPFVSFWSPKTIVKYYRFKYTDGDKDKKVTIRLTQQEYTSISNFTAQKDIS